MRKESERQEKRVREVSIAGEGGEEKRRGEDGRREHEIREERTGEERSPLSRCPQHHHHSRRVAPVFTELV